MQKLINICLVAAVILLLYSCTASYDMSSNINTDFKGRISKMLVLVINTGDSLSRFEMEESVSGALNTGSKRSDSYYKIFPNAGKKSADEILSAMQTNGYDGLLIVSPFEDPYSPLMEIPVIKHDSTVKAGALIGSYINYKIKSGMYSSVPYGVSAALFSIPDENLVWVAKGVKETSIYKFMGSVESNLGESIRDELLNKKLIK